VQFEKFIEDWHPRVIEWWHSVWTSPMAEEYLGADIKGGLYLLAELHQRRWTETQTAVLIGLAAEIRQQEIRFGLSPIDRRRLQWSIEQGETADERTKRRRESKQLTETSKKDPRNVLGLVK
jgi:preprotein translocase subunit SecD